MSDTPSPTSNAATGSASSPNPDGSPATPNPIIAPGNTVLSVPKNPLQSTALWGLVVMLVTAGVSKWVPAIFQSAAINSALEIIGWLAGTALVAYGRWTAHRPLGFSDAVKSAVVK